MQHGEPEHSQRHGENKVILCGLLYSSFYFKFAVTFWFCTFVKSYACALKYWYCYSVRFKVGVCMYILLHNINFYLVVWSKYASVCWPEGSQLTGSFSLFFGRVLLSHSSVSTPCKEFLICRSWSPTGSRLTHLLYLQIGYTKHIVLKNGTKELPFFLCS